MLIKNARYLDDTFTFQTGDLLIANGRIAEIREQLAGQADYDLSGKMLLPGLVNIHTHGAVGYDAVSASGDELNEISKYWASTGTTSFLPTTSTALKQDLTKAMQTISHAIKMGVEGAEILGINMEGPYLSKEYKGAHRADWLSDPETVRFADMQRAACGTIRLVTLAPELEGAMAFVEEFADSVRISLGHTGASYAQCQAAFSKGARHVTHLFNAMPTLHHRNLSLIAAAFEKAESVELICDGLHVSPTVVLMAIKLFGCDRIVVINDSTNATGMPEGTYQFCGETVVVRDGLARKTDGTISGGTQSLLQCVKNLTEWGVPLESAVKMASYNPAAAIGAMQKGCIRVDMDADLIVVDTTLNLEKVFIRGREFAIK